MKLNRPLAAALSFGGLWLWTKLLTHSLLLSLLVERHEAQPDAKTRRRTACVYLVFTCSKKEVLTSPVKR